MPQNGWNRPSSVKKPEPTKKPAALRGALAGIVIVAIAGLAAYFIFSKSDSSPKAPADKDRGLIKEVKPAVAPKAVEKAPEPKKIDPNARPTKVGEMLNGYIKLPSGRLHKVKGVITNNMSQVKSKYEIFDYHCENEIACMLTIQPGQTLVGTPRYNGRFKAEFLESLKTPIIPSKDDSEEDAALKRAVNDAKIELKAALDRGEDIEQIMLDTRKEFQDLYRYKMEIQQELNEFKRKEGVTNEDVEDFVTACNQMLEKKGIAPLKLGPLSRQRLKMLKQEESK